MQPRALVTQPVWRQPMLLRARSLLGRVRGVGVCLPCLECLRSSCVPPVRVVLGRCVPIVPPVLMLWLLLLLWAWAWVLVVFMLSLLV